MRGTGDVIDVLFSEVYERGSLFACCESVSSAPTTTNARCSSLICDRFRSKWCGCLAILGKRHVRWCCMKCGTNAENNGGDASSRACCQKMIAVFFMTMTTMYFVWRLQDCLCSIVPTGH